jgi:hypothetical protein
MITGRFYRGALFAAVSAAAWVAANGFGQVGIDHRKADAAYSRFFECTTFAVAQIDDGISAAESIADAILRSFCRSVVANTCMVRETNPAPCDPDEENLVVETMRPHVVASVLRFRALKRLGTGRR